MNCLWIEILTRLTLPQARLYLAGQGGVSVEYSTDLPAVGSEIWECGPYEFKASRQYLLKAV